MHTSAKSKLLHTMFAVVWVFLTFRATTKYIFVVNVRIVMLS